MNLSDKDLLKILQNSKPKSNEESQIDPADYYYRRLKKILNEQSN